MAFLNYLNIRTKLIILSAVPIFVLLALLIQFVINNNNELTNMHKAKKQLKL